MRRALVPSGLLLVFILAGCASVANTPAQDLAWERWRQCSHISGILLKEIRADGQIWVTYFEPSGLAEWRTCDAQALARQRGASAPVAARPSAAGDRVDVPDAGSLITAAFFTPEAPVPGKRFLGNDHPPKISSFDADVHGRVVFYYFVRQLHRTVRLRTEWYEPSGAHFDVFMRTLDQTREPSWAAFYTPNVVPMSRIKDQPGTWTVVVLVDDEKVGTHQFTLQSTSDRSATASGVRAEQPTLRVGDRWIRSDGVYELARQDGEALVFTLGGTEHQFHVTGDGGTLRIVQRGETMISYDPPFPHFKWPLEVGKQWTHVGKQVNKITGFDGETRSVIRVLAYEDVVTPAGQFKAFKLATGSITYWYSPEARTVIKYLTTSRGTVGDYVLVAFDRDASREPPVVPTPARALTPADLRPYYGNSWAVVIGIDRYAQAAVPSLNYAVADARAIAAVLPGLGFDRTRITLLENARATRGAIEQALYGSLSAMGRDDRLFIFFAGHGTTQTIRGREEGYLMSVDSDPANLPLTALAMRDVAQIGRRLPAKHVFLAIDSCFSGYAVTRDVAAYSAGSDLVALTNEPVVQILTAGTHGQRAAEEGGHGIFTRHLIKGLEGWADPQGTGLTGVKLVGYIQERVVRDSQGIQTPQYGKLDGEGEFLFRPPRAPSR